jgi:hypothetical protein
MSYIHIRLILQPSCILCYYFKYLTTIHQQYLHVEKCCTVLFSTSPIVRCCERKCIPVTWHTICVFSFPSKIHDRFVLLLQSWKVRAKLICIHAPFEWVFHCFQFTMLTDLHEMHAKGKASGPFTLKAMCARCCYPTRRTTQKRGEWRGFEAAGRSSANCCRCNYATRFAN